MKPTSPGPVAASLERVVLDAHAQIRVLMDAARAASPQVDDPRRATPACDQLIALLSQHLAAVEDVVYATARHRLPDGRHRVAQEAHVTRELERYVHLLLGSYYGDGQARGVDRAEIWDELQALFDEHAAGERRLLADLTLSAEVEISRVMDFEAAVERAPTRPHPFIKHSGRLARWEHRMWAAADRALDEMDNRAVPHKHREPADPTTPWSRYLLGASAAPPAATSRLRIHPLPEQPSEPTRD